MSYTITSFGNDHWYPKGLHRLKESCQKFNVPCETFQDYPPSCPHHSRIPYAFKPYVIDIVSKRYDQVFYADASAWLINDPKPIFEIIKEQGYILFFGGWNNAQWCSDRQLEAFGYNRDQAEQQHHVVGGLFGIDFTSEIGQTIFKIYKNSINLFTGQWKNDLLTESADPRCLGCRHDQSVLSLIAASLNLTLTNPSEFFSYDINQKDCIFVLQGM